MYESEKIILILHIAIASCEDTIGMGIRPLYLSSSIFGFPILFFGLFFFFVVVFLPASCTICLEKSDQHTAFEIAILVRSRENTTT